MRPPVTIRAADNHLGCYLLALPALQSLLLNGVRAGYADDPFELGLPIVEDGVALVPIGEGHAAERYVRAAAFVGGVPPATPYPLPTPRSTRYAGRVMVAPWARVASKRAPLEWWREYLRGESYVLNAPDEGAEYAEEFLEAVPGGERDPIDDAHTWRSYLAGAERVVAVDSGAMHLADALGVPTTGVFVSTAPASFAPYWSRSYVEAR